jgi:hypothetical protein
MVISLTKLPAPTLPIFLKREGGGGDCEITSKVSITSEVTSYKMDPAKVKNLINKIPKFIGQNEEIQLEEFVQQIEDFAELVQWRTRYEDGENEEICLLFRNKLEGLADQIWRFLKEEEINLNIWENVKSQFQEYYPM